MKNNNATPVAEHTRLNAVTLAAIGALAIIAETATYRGIGEGRIPFSAFWLIGSVLVSGLFVAILGPGIQFSNGVSSDTAMHATPPAPAP
jgi:hypothetical protein